jgi:hypothetical protein
MGLANTLVFNDAQMVCLFFFLKKLVVKAPGFPYQFEQMHRVGAGVNCFYPKSVCACTRKKRIQKQQLTGGTNEVE